MILFNESWPHSWEFEHDYPEGADEAFDECVDLYHAGDLEHAEQTLKDILFVCPDHIDALHHLALVYENTDRSIEAYLCTREAVRICLEAIPAHFSWLTEQILWGEHNNRPFLRAYHSLALHHLRRQNTKDASDILARLVSTNPNDNLGARYVLMTCLLNDGNWETAIKLTKQYPDDTGPEIAYSKVIALLHLGCHNEAKENLKWAIQQNRKVAIELLKTQHTRPEAAFPGYTTLGGEEEAFIYWEQNSIHWSKDSEAFKLLHELMQKNSL